MNYLKNIYKFKRDIVEEGGEGRLIIIFIFVNIL